MSDYFKRVSALTPTRFWVNNVTPEQAREGIAAGAVGCTQNPSYLDKMFSARPEHCRDMAKKYIGQYDSDTEVLIQLAHIAGIYDECLGNYAKANAIDISPDVLWHAGIAVAKKVHAIITERRYPVKFLGGGARGLHHFTEMVGVNGTVTINWKGAAEDLLKENPVVVQRWHMPTPARGNRARKKLRRQERIRYTQRRPVLPGRLCYCRREETCLPRKMKKTTSSSSSATRR